MRWSLQFFSDSKLAARIMTRSSSLTTRQTRWFCSANYYQRVEIAKKQLDNIAWLYGLESPTYAEQLNNYGIELHLAGYKKEALQALQAALQTKINLYGHKHPDLASTYANLASLLAGKNMLEEAIEFYEKAIELKHTYFGYHPEIALIKSNLASVYLQQGDTNKAQLLFEQAYTSLLKTYGESDERTVKVKAQLDACPQVISNSASCR